MEKRIRVGCYGAKGSYTYEAIERHFGKWEREEIYFSLFEDVTKAVAGGMIDYGVVPIENSSTGGITEVYDLIRGCGCAIVGEELVKIEHHLLGCRERKWKISIRSTPIPRDLPSAVLFSMNIGIGN